MATNLIKAVQEKLGIVPIEKIDPNTQDVKTATTTDKHTVEQAALPTVLAGLYKYSTTDAGATDILSAYSDNWVGHIFAANTEEMVQHVAAYAGSGQDEAYQKMEAIAKEAVAITNSEVKNKDDINGLRSYLQGQRKDILTYLPAEVHAGDLLNDNTIDDRTNKMEGPVSSLMKKIAGLFTSSEGPADNTHQF